MTLGLAPTQGDLLRSTVVYCEGRVGEDSIYAVLHRECFNLFPDAMFADLFTDVGRRSVPPMIVAVTMVLQRVEGLSDREAVDRFAFDARWKYAAGGLDFDYPGFVHTVLVDMRARLARSERPDRIFEVTLAAARSAGLVGRKRVLDSRPLYDAVATVLGQDLDVDETGVFRIARRVAKDRVISTVDPQTRHGHKTAARGFDGYKAHLGIDPDSELITATTVTPGNAGDASVAEDLIADLLDEHADDSDADQDTADTGPGTDEVAQRPDAAGENASVGDVGHDGDDGDDGDGTDPACVYGDNAYGTGSFHDRLEQDGIESKCKSQQPANSGGRFNKNDFGIDLESDTVTCPAKNTAPIRHASNGAGTADFGQACAGCPLREQCTTSGSGRTIMIGLYQRQLAAARDRQRDPDWVADYRATRPKVERKIGHLMRRHHGGRRARVRGQTKVAADFALLAAAVNLARLGVLGLTSTGGKTWVAATS